MNARMAKQQVEGVRLDIQLIRALAVGGVLVYHLWPNRVPGGFVGVDIFFVISGFLITSHLLRSAVGPSGVHLGRFWANRARRLLPLASVVLLASVVAVFAFLPQSTWKTSLQGIVSSALYVENWNLAAGSVDYLARDQAPTIVQHFWSLSVEEQFYLVWPLLMLVAVWLAAKIVRRRSRRPGGLGEGAAAAAHARAVRGAALLAILVIFAASFTCSVWLTATDPGLAYFATTTRAWEFAAGAILAFLPQSAPVLRSDRLPNLRLAASWSGVALMVGTMIVLTTDVPFPGVVAAIPVLGTCLFIWAGDIHRVFAPTILARVRPITYLGDISYGVYLWHWPLIIAVPAALSAPLTTMSKVGIIVVTIGLAAASKVLIEDPFRFRQFWRARWWRGFYPASIGMITVCMLAVLGLTSIQVTGSTAVAAGGAPLALRAATDPYAPLTPTLANRTDDRGTMYDCFDMDKSGPYVCTYGADEADVSIAVTGDSHAAHLIPGLIDVVERRGWKLTTFVGMNCDDGDQESCKGGKEIAEGIISGDFDLVIYSAFRGSSSPLDGVTDYVTKLHESGVRLMPIEDVPLHPSEAYACMDESGGDAATAEECTTPVSVAFGAQPDRVAPIAKSIGVPSVSLRDVFCSDADCRSIDGNVIIYQDSPSSHLTATFSRLLAARLGTEIEARLAEQSTS